MLIFSIFRPMDTKYTHRNYILYSIRMGDHESREFPNPFKDYDARKDLTAEGYESDFLAQLSQCQTKLRDRLERDKETFESQDTSIYTGTSGVAYMYWRLSCILSTEQERNSAFERCLRLVNDAIDRRRKKRTTFLCGEPGPLALGAVIYRDERAGHDDKRSDKCVTLICDMSRHMTDVDDRDTPDELLYGRVGYLFALLFLLKHLGSSVADKVEGIIGDVVDAVLRSGQRLAKEERSSSPLMFQWHDRHYVGAAHGISGICAVLLQTVLFLPHDVTLKLKVEKYVKPTMEFVISERLASFCVVIK